MAGPPGAAALLLQSLLAGATPAAEPAADARKSRSAIRSPSATGGRFDRRKILRRSADVVRAARGLRVGRQGCGCCEQNCDRKGERSFAHRFSPSSAAMSPRVRPSPVDLTRPAVLVHVDDRSAVLRCRSPSCLCAARVSTSLRAVSVGSERRSSRVFGWQKQRSPGRDRSGALVQ
jgi:hypothetical protein